MINIFVYGSLATDGRYNKYYLGGKTFLGKGIVKGYKKYILGGGLDCIRPQEGQRIQGEVYEIDQAALARLDFLHNDTLFTRNIVDVDLENGERIQAEAYIWNGSVC